MNHFFQKQINKVVSTPIIAALILKIKKIIILLQSKEMYKLIVFQIKIKIFKRPENLRTHFRILIKV